MEVKVEIQAKPVKDEISREEFPVKTVRTAKDIAEFLDESEKDAARSKLERTADSFLLMK